MKTRYFQPGKRIRQLKTMRPLCLFIMCVFIVTRRTGMRPLCLFIMCVFIVTRRTGMRPLCLFIMCVFIVTLRTGMRPLCLFVYYSLWLNELGWGPCVYLCIIHCDSTNWDEALVFIYYVCIHCGSTNWDEALVFIYVLFIVTLNKLGWGPCVYLCIIYCDTQRTGVFT